MARGWFRRVVVCAGVVLGVVWLPVSGHWPGTRHLRAQESPRPGVLAQDGPDLRVALAVDTTVIHLGDPISVRLVVDHPADWSVRWADSLDIAPFEVLGYAVAVPEGSPAMGGGAAPISGGAARSVAALTITSFELGELEIPPIAVAVAAPDGTVRTLLTDPYRIGVESVGLDDSGDIREIKGPLAIARNWWIVAPWLLLAAAAGAGALYLYRRAQTRPVAEIAKPQPPPRPHHLVALEALDELERSSLLERGRVKRWHVRVSEIVRTYVEGQLEVPALEMTTGEVAAGLRAAALGGRITVAFHTFLTRCDLVKFAKLRPGADTSREMLGAARSLVAMTSGPGREAEAGEHPGAADDVERPRVPVAASAGRDTQPDEAAKAPVGSDEPAGEAAAGEAAGGGR